MPGDLVVDLNPQMLEKDVSADVSFQDASTDVCKTQLQVGGRLGPRVLWVHLILASQSFKSKYAYLE